MLKKFLPQTVDFFAFFKEHCVVLTKACQELLLMTEVGADLSMCAGRIKDLERAGDDVTRRCIKALQKTFITPFDRTEIKALVGGLDDILDAIDEAVSRIVLYDIRELRPQVRTFAEILVRASEKLGEALTLLENLKNEAAINQKCIAILKLENEGDETLRNALHQLFTEVADPILIIKWKEIFEYLEEATDVAEDVANDIHGIVIEAS